MTLGQKLLVKVLGGELLRRVTESQGVYLFWPGRRHRVEHPDYEQLRRAYEEKPFVQRICENSTDFLFAGGFKIRSEDPDAAEDLARFYATHEEELDQAGIDGALYGNAALIEWWDDEEKRLRLRAESAAAVRRIPRLLMPWKTDGYRIVVEMDEGRFEQTLTTKESVIRAGRSVSRQPNPYGALPIQMVRERRRSGDENGIGVITTPVFDLCDMYGELAAAGYEGESYHGNPIPFAKGVKNSGAFAKAMEEGSWGSTQMLELSGDGEVGFVETKRGSEGCREHMKMLFHGVIVETGIPEYVWGVHMESAQASTKEQRDVVQRHAARRRRSWTPRLLEANEAILRMLEYHTGRTYRTYETNVEWGPAVEADKAADAAALQSRVSAVESARLAGLLSRKSGIRALPKELVSDPEAELKAVEEEIEELGGGRGEEEGTGDERGGIEEPGGELQGRWVTLENGEHVLIGAEGGTRGAGGGGGGVGANVVAASGETPGGAKYWVEQDIDPDADDVSPPRAHVEANGKKYEGPARLKDGNVVVSDRGRNVTVTVKPEDQADVKRVFDAHDETRASRARAVNDNVPGLAEVRAASEAHAAAVSRYGSARATAQEHEDFRPVTKPSPALAERRAAASTQYPRAALYVKAEQQEAATSWADNSGRAAAAREAKRLLRKGAPLDEVKTALAKRRN